LANRYYKTSQKQQILLAAKEEYALHGFSGTRMQAIANRAGLPKANIHYHFKNKQGLYLAVLDQIIDTWNQPFEWVSTDDDPAVALDNFIRTKVQQSYDDPAASRLFASEIIQGAPHLQEYLRNRMRPWVKARAVVIESWISAGKMRDTDPYQLIFMIWASTQHYADFQAQVLAILNKAEFDMDLQQETASFISGIILRGCGLSVKEQTP
jgi:TetR/AcrR family transcriptional regulator